MASHSRQVSERAQHTTIAQHRPIDLERGHDCRQYQSTLPCSSMAVRRKAVGLQYGRIEKLQAIFSLCMR